MSGEELKRILKDDGIVLSDLAKMLGYDGDQRLHSALNAADVKSGLIENIARVLNKSVGHYYRHASVNAEGTNVALGDGAHVGGDIKNVNSHAIDRCLDMLGEQLGKKDDQIDRLIGLLEGRRCGDGR